MSPGFPCPCCGFLTLPAPPGSDEIGPVCFWQDDTVDAHGTAVVLAYETGLVRPGSAV